MNNIHIEGIILSRVNFGEADRILTIFSKEKGRVRVISKGSRKLKSKLASHIEPFSVGKYFLVQGKSLYILAGAEAVEQNEGILNNLDVYKDACYVSELISMTIFEEVPQPGLFDIARDVYLHLPSFDVETREIILRFFEYKLLEASGYTPNFHKCKHCGSELSEQEMYEGGFEGVSCTDCQPHNQKISKTSVKTMRLFANNDLDTVLQVRDLPKYNSEIKDILHPFLYDILPRTPKAREM